MAKANSAKSIEESEPEKLPVTEMITYVPGEGDPAFVVWAGHKFHANVAKEITGWGHKDASVSEKNNLHLIERARDNKSFRVGNDKIKRDVKRDPETAEEYRGYFVEWLKTRFDHAEELIARFAKDRELQIACGVGTDDFEYMQTLLVPKLHELAKADELTDQQLASVWVRYGFNQLPW